MVKAPTRRLAQTFEALASMATNDRHAKLTPSSRPSRSAVRPILCSSGAACTEYPQTDSDGMLVAGPNEFYD